MKEAEYRRMSTRMAEIHFENWIPVYQNAKQFVSAIVCVYLFWADTISAYKELIFSIPF
jgi:hypothetical protein